MADRFDVIVAGHLCLDIVLQLPATMDVPLLRPGQTTQIPPATLTTGGAVCNTGLGLHRLGMAVGLMSKVGDDLWGQATLDIIRSFGANLMTGLRIVNESAAYTFVINSPDTDHIFLGVSGPNISFGIDDIDYDLLTRTRCFHFGYPPLLPRTYADDGAEFAELLRRARAAGAIVSLDMSMPDMASTAIEADWNAILTKVLPHVDLFLPSIGEMLLLLDRPIYDRLCTAPTGLVDALTPEIVTSLADRLLEMGASTIGLKLGQRGFYLRTGSAAQLRRLEHIATDDISPWIERELWAPAFKAQVVGTTGAGDATIAGFLTSLLRGLPPESSLRIACAAGASNVEVADAQGGLRSWPEITERADTSQQHPLDLTPQGWRFDPSERIWIGPRDRSTAEH